MGWSRLHVSDSVLAFKAIAACTQAQVEEQDLEGVAKMRLHVLAGIFFLFPCHLQHVTGNVTFVIWKPHHLRHGSVLLHLVK